MSDAITNRSYQDNNAVIWHSQIDDGGFTFRRITYCACKVGEGASCKQLCVCVKDWDAHFQSHSAKVGWPKRYRRAVIDACSNHTFDDPFAKTKAPEPCNKAAAWILEVKDE